ncbi:MAG: hypothetical protein AYP45_11090 [Candidatus Brocadia carolinensis]|uniref:Uncharacterized protein n=1 Tax=Candidatus Brocadia carolinensis TaxID=1004156 RepID=A0A1V4ASM5_9BACT|nr:MAG: hypothetical protein AYP45_11090 [Candidatus Brocadia caroliniensis]
MQDKSIDKALEAVKPFAAIDKKIRPYADPKVPELMYKLVTDDIAYEHFSANPESALSNEGIDSSKLDVDMFASLAKTLRDRAQGIQEIAMLPATYSYKQQAAGFKWNFDNSSSWLFQVENWIWTSRGYYKEKSTSEDAAVDRGFRRSGVERLSDEILKHEIDLLFFPAQPLVTPELVSKIKQSLISNQEND